MMTVEEATENLTTAESSLARFDAEIAKATAEENAAHALRHTLQERKASGDVGSNPLKFLADLDKANAAAEQKSRARADMITIRPSLHRRVEEARIVLRAAKATAARPEADRREAESKRLFREWAAYHRECLLHRKENNLPSDGSQSSFNGNGHGLAAILNSEGLAVETYALSPSHLAIMRTRK